ncbi:MAG: gamma-glutamylcyclotransferase, partial [Lachnospiraceae bacterium]|nr:gamma-glutamylcyclotransferase [Lachnospiraceae bacterium]
MAKRKKYMAYGSNLNQKQMKFRCPTAKVIGIGEVKGYELLFKGSPYGAFATIEPKEGAKVPVLIWEVGPEDEN